MNYLLQAQDPKGRWTTRHKLPNDMRGAVLMERWLVDRCALTPRRAKLGRSALTQEQARSFSLFTLSP